jgi:tRNA G26 N,N-dimethylase Trm1
MRNQNQNTENISGLLRFELSLKRDYLKQHTKYAVNHLGYDELTALLCETLEQAEPLMQNYLIDPLWSGEMLSKELQRKRIKNNYHGKKERRKKMLAYIRKCNKDNVESIDRSERILEHFEAINLSPICTSEEFQQIPSFSELLNRE